MKQVVAIFILLFLSWEVTSGSEKIKVSKLKCENFLNPQSIDLQSPKLSWIIYSDGYGISQSAYHIQVADNTDLLLKDSANIWDSGKIDSDRSIQVPYAGSPLKSGKKYYWRVKVWGQSGNESDWSDISFWQMGLLYSEDWENARWIAYEEMADSMRVVPGVHGSGNKLGEKGKQRPVVPIFRKNFNLNRKIASATLFISGLGQYEAYLNGEKVGNASLTPGWTDYDKTVFYNTYDVASDLKTGGNAIGIIVGNGFYNVNRERYRKLVIAYGMPKMICKLSVVYDDGSSDIIVSDTGWKTAPSPITYTSIYGGEDYDAQLEQQGWNEPGFDDSEWKQALQIHAPKGELHTERDYPVSVMDRFETQRIRHLSDSCSLYDFGQNVSGIVELKIKGKKGQQVRLIPAELINEDGTANQRATGSPYFYTYTLKGEGLEVWRPRFTYYGFRYVQVEGAVPRSSDTHGELPVVSDLKLLHTRNSAPQNGSFECSNELFNRIYSLINWAIKSNLQSVVTDCPHREKLGWMEQTFLMGAGINFNDDSYHLYKKLVYDMMDAQTSDGLVPGIAPEFVDFGGDFRDSPEWGSAAVQLPWLIYQWYDDKTVMEEAWPMMVKYVEYLKSKSDKHILSYGLGDWYDLGPNHPGYAQLTPKGITATSIYYSDVKLLAQMAALLNKTDDQKHFEKWAEAIRLAFNNEFFDSKKKVYATGSQTSMAMPLCLGLVEDQYRKDVLNNLVDSIRANGNALTAGDVGFHYLVQALTEGGASQLLFEMNNRDDVPGYGYQLKKGATTLTESWQALSGVSNNHLMLGHIMEWFYRGLGGIRQAKISSGYKNIVISPEVVGGITYTKVSYLSPHGMIKSHWEKKENIFILHVEIPVNTQATIYLPYEGEVSINEYENPEEQIARLKYTGIYNGRMVYLTGSGKYEFKVKLNVK